MIGGAPMKWLSALPVGAIAFAAHASVPLGPVVVVATRIPEPEFRIPADISVVPGTDLAARGATDLAGALALVSGVEAPAGGDAGPSSAVPAFWGLHEFDAFLLVVDGTPWGGAFNPAIPSLDLTDVERIEVLKGAAPVMYGATSFVGVVNVVHYPAGKAPNAVDLAVGNYGSAGGSAAYALPGSGRYRQSFAIDGQKRGFADPRESADNLRMLYRGALPLGQGKLKIDAGTSFTRDVPPSPVLRAGTALAALSPIDANFNSADAKIDENQYHLSADYARPTALGDWDTLVSYTHTDITDIRAFLHPDASGTADTQNQRRRIEDAYFDSHLSHRWAEHLTLTVGADVLYGHGRQTSLNGNDAYTVPLSGAVLPPSTAAIPVGEIGTVDDHRLFAGEYAQVDWKIGSRWDVLAGVRLNETSERKASSDLVLAPPQLDSASVRKSFVKPTETIGASYLLSKGPNHETVVYVDFRNAFKPAAIDFGPDYTPDVLSPETAQSYEAGIKGRDAAGRVSYRAELFSMDFENLVVPTASGALANAAKQRLRGVELESQDRVTKDFSVRSAFSYHDSRYTKYVIYDGATPVDVSGRLLPLSPHLLYSVGAQWLPARGWNATATASYVGRRFLDEENTAAVGGYTTFAATFGYCFGRYTVSLQGTNLTNRRPPVSASEFGSQSFYMMPARTVWLGIRYQ